MKRRMVYFVVLHCQTIKETQACVQTLVRQESEEISVKVIIVDNASPNQSGKLLERRYQNNQQVTVICNSCNLGFARGNNVGFEAARKNGADYIVLLNNDTLIRQEHFVDKIELLYHKYHFGVLGPDILSVYDKVHQNPMDGFTINVCSLCTRIMRSYLIRLLNWTGIYPFLTKHSDGNKNYHRECVPEHMIQDISHEILHGSCLIFSRDFISRYNGLFDGTFLYYEEHILAYICRENHIRMLYSPALQIEHYRGVSTKYGIKNIKGKTEFLHKETIRSLKAFLKLVIKSGH